MDDELEAYPFGRPDGSAASAPPGPPTRLERLHTRAEQALARGDREDAAAIYFNLLEEDGENDEAFRGLRQALALEGEAVGFLREAVRIDGYLQGGVAVILYLLERLGACWTPGPRSRRARARRSPRSTCSWPACSRLRWRPGWPHATSRSSAAEPRG